MALKYKISIFFFYLIIHHCISQNKYLAFDHFSYALKQKSIPLSNLPSSKMSAFNGTYVGGSVQLGFGPGHSFGLGLGLNKISYEKQWLGNFPESEKFGVATLNGMIQYLSIPLSLTFIQGLPNRYYASRYSNLCSGFTFAYTPSFRHTNNHRLQTYGGADSSIFLSTYNPSPRKFQHSFSIGFCCQRFLFKKTLRLAIEPYVGCGSSYFSVKGKSTSFNYGIKLQLSLRLARIRLVKEVIPGNTEEKKKLLEQKQKEIKEQLNKQP